MRAAAHIDVGLGLPLALARAALPPTGKAFERGLVQTDDNDVWLVVAGAPGL